MKKKVFIIILLLTIAMIVYGYNNVNAGNCETAMKIINVV